MRRKWRIMVSISVAAMLLLSVIIVGCAPAPPAESPTLHLKASQAMMPKDALTHLCVIEMCDRITERTDGKITWDIFGPEIGDWTELEIMVKKGTIDLQFNAFATGFDPRWNILYLPFLASTFEEAREVCGPGGPFDEMGKIFAPDGDMYYLGTFLNNVGMLGLNTDPIMTPEQAKGVKIRVWPAEIPKIYIEKMGFTAVTIPWAEAPTAIATGVADGWIGSGSVYHWMLFRDVARTQMITFDFLEIWAITMNLDRWNALPKEYQEIIQEEAVRIIAKRLDQVEEEELEYRQKLIDYGWTVVNMAEEYPNELKVWQELAREAWDEIEPLVGKIWMDKLKVAMGIPVD